MITAIVTIYTLNAVFVNIPTFSLSSFLFLFVNKLGVCTAFVVYIIHCVYRFILLFFCFGQNINYGLDLIFECHFNGISNGCAKTRTWVPIIFKEIITAIVRLFILFYIVFIHQSIAFSNTSTGHTHFTFHIYRTELNVWRRMSEQLFLSSFCCRWINVFLARNFMLDGLVVTKYYVWCVMNVCVSCLIASI